MNFLNYYNHPKNFRYDSFKFALSEAYKRKLKIFVETGVARGKQKIFFFSRINWKDGMSTMIFSDYVKLVQGHLYSCDIKKINVYHAKKFVKKNLDVVSFFIDDSLKFLNNFDKKIDFLYLDSLDGQFEGASKHQLKEVEIVLAKLNKNALILLDDKGVKTKLSINYLLENSYKIVNETKEQVLLSL